MKMETERLLPRSDRQRAPESQRAERIDLHLHNALASAALQNSALHQCVYIVIACRGCGEVRQALLKAPAASQTFCPQCLRPADFVVLGVGVTTRPLPFHEIHPRDAGGLRKVPWDRLRPKRLLGGLR